MTRARLHRPANRPSVLVATLTVLLAVAPGRLAAQRSCTSQTIGSSTFTSCSDGSGSTAQRIGGTVFETSTSGASRITQRIGSTDFSTSSTGVTTTRQRIGSTDFYTLTGPAGSGSGTGQRIGSTYILDLTTPTGAHLTSTSTRIGTVTTEWSTTTPPVTPSPDRWARPSRPPLDR